MEINRSNRNAMVLENYGRVIQKSEHVRGK